MSVIEDRMATETELNVSVAALNLALLWIVSRDIMDIIEEPYETAPKSEKRV